MPKRAWQQAIKRNLTQLSTRVATWFAVPRTPDAAAGELPASSFSAFRRTSQSAHKEPLTSVFTPTLTWHRSFLIPRRADNRSARHRPDEIGEKLDVLIIKFARRLRGQKISCKLYPVVAQPIANQTETKTVVMFSRLLADNETLDDLPTPAASKRELFDGDERTIVLEVAYRKDEVQGGTAPSTQAKQPPDEWQVTIRVQVRANLFSITCFAAPPKALAGACYETPAPDRPETPRLELRSDEQFQKFTLDFWRGFAQFMNDKGGLSRADEAHLFSCEFADIRGVILPCDELHCGAGAPRERTALPPWADPIIKEFRPIITASERFECSASYMLDRRVLHMTALGPQRRNPYNFHRRPITFILCVHARDAQGDEMVGPRQLGRLLDRMHLLGTLRLAALLDLKELRDASVRLSEIDEVKEQARRGVAEYEKEEKNAPYAVTALQAFRQGLDNITRVFLTENLAGVGLTFRIESSRYYVSQFQKNLKALRLDRIEGYQPYDQFVERRLGVTFEFIDRLGFRYERALKERSELDQSFASIQVRHTGRAIARIQELGEFVLFAVLMPYYLIAAVAHIIEAGPKAATQHDAPKAAAAHAHQHGESYWQLIFIAIWVLCVAVAVWKLRAIKVTLWNLIMTAFAAMFAAGIALVLFRLLGPF